VKNEHIDTIRRQLGISFAAVQKYNRDHRNEIEHIKDIFTLKGDYREKYLALLYMFCSADEDFVKRYREQAGLEKAEYEPSKLLERYKVLLITALVYNEDFYAMVINDIGFASMGIDIKEAGRDSLFSVVQPGEQNRRGNIIGFPKSGSGTSEDRIAVREVERSPVNQPSTSTGKTNKFPINLRRFSQSSKRTIIIAFAASFVFIFFITILIRSLNIGPGPQISNAWGSIIKEPEKAADGIAYVPMEDMGVRIDILSPLVGRARGAGNETGNKETINYYTKLLRNDKTNTDLYINRGVAYTLDGYIEAAIKDFNKAIELDPQNASAYYNRAVANAGRNVETDTVAADFKTAIAINPDDKDAYYALGVLYYRQYDKDKATAHLESAIDAFGHIKGYKDTDDILDYLNDLKK